MKTATRCTVCGSSRGPFTGYVNTDTGKKDRVCSDCTASEMVASANSLEELDRVIAENEDIVDQLEKIIKLMGSKKPRGVLGFTPLSALKAAQRSLADLKSKRFGLLHQKETVEQLRYEHNRCVQEENYEEADLVLKRLKILEVK